MSLPAAHPGGRVAFHAPMKPPTHPAPSGDRRIARLTVRALRVAGFEPFLASELRTLAMTGERTQLHALLAEADLEVERLLEDLSDNPPALWFTYHCYWKAPDLIGPRVARALSIPYVISEASRSPKRFRGPWAAFAEAADAALNAADLLFWTTERDRPMLAELPRATRRLVHMPAFIDPGPPPAPRAPRGGPLELVAVAMMRPGDKISSYLALAEALEQARSDWRLTVIGDGAARAEAVTGLLPLGDRVRHLGAIDDPARLRELLEEADMLVWPGIGEGVGMVYLEAQAAGLPCLAEDRPGPRDLIAPRGAPLGHLPAPADPRAFAARVDAAAADRAGLAALGRAARERVEERHSLAAAAELLARRLGALAGAA